LEAEESLSFLLRLLLTMPITISALPTISKLPGSGVVVVPSIIAAPSRTSLVSHIAEPIDMSV
jgi:hypothetical protein